MSALATCGISQWCTFISKATLGRLSSYVFALITLKKIIWCVRFLMLVRSWVEDLLFTSTLLIMYGVHILQKGWKLVAASRLEVLGTF